jgi:hypothetical protein
MFFNIDGGRFWIYSSGTSQGGPPSMFFNVDGGRSWVYSSGISQGVRRQRFLTLMVDTPGSPSPTRSREPAVDIF